MRPRHARRGSIVLLSIFFLVTLFFLATALLQLMPVELNAARWARMNQEASYAADAGITEAITWLEEVLAGNQGRLSDLIEDIHKEGSFGGWKWVVDIQPDQQTKENNPVRVFRITSVAKLDGQPYRRIVAEVRQDSFAQYLSFIGSSPNNTYWALTRSAKMEGPTTTNGSRPGSPSSKGPTPPQDSTPPRANPKVSEMACTTAAKMAARTTPTPPTTRMGFLYPSVMIASSPEAEKL
jgi:hypothetical protein